MPDFVPVAKVHDIPAGTGRAFPIGGRMVAVFSVDGEFYALDDFCPHMGASLAGGHVEQKFVSCPWHAWCFSIEDGSWCDNPSIKVDCFEVKVEGDDVLVKLPPGG